MIIQIITSLQNANKAKGLTIVIDVLRAFTTVCYLFTNGAKRIMSVMDLDTAYALKRKHPFYPTIGERNGIKPSDFDWGNSPAELERTSFEGKTVIFTTTAGTTGIRKAIHADEVITGAFVNASAIANYVKRRNPTQVTLLCTNDRHTENEDMLCAKYIRSLLRGHPMNFGKIQTRMRTHPSADGFLHHPLTEWSKKDFDLCLSLDMFDFVVRAQKNNPIILERL